MTKGAPQVILNVSHNADELRARVQQAVQELADRGFRSLGVGVTQTGGTMTEMMVIMIMVVLLLRIGAMPFSRMVDDEENDGNREDIVDDPLASVVDDDSSDADADAGAVDDDGHCHCS